MKALKVFIRPFVAPQKVWKSKFNLIFSLRPALGREVLNNWLDKLRNSRKLTKQTLKQCHSAGHLHFSGNFLTLKHFQYITSFLPKCFHFIPPENTRKQWFLYFIREYNMEKLARNGLILRIWRCSAKFPLYESTTFNSIIQQFITSVLTWHTI